MNLAIIPARGGSKGIPGKNITPVCGRPLIVWTIEQALLSDVDAVVVTTDSDEIDEVADDCGAHVFRRSAHTATDTASTESAVLEVIEQDDYSHASTIVLLQCTSPIRQPGDIDRGISILHATHCDSVFSARRVEGYTWRATKGGVSRQYHRQPRQLEAATTLEENGSIYVFRRRPFEAAGDRICGTTMPLMMHPLDSFQVDTPEDLELMELLIPLRLGHGHHLATQN